MHSETNVSILGVPLGYGASMAGVDIGPAALRVARLNQRIARLGYSVHDLGDMRLERPQTNPEADEKLKYVREISSACEQLATEVETILASGSTAINARRRSLNRDRFVCRRRCRTTKSSNRHSD